MSAPQKRSCCGGKIDITKFGRCRFCMAVAFLSTLLFYGLYYLSSAQEWPSLLSYLFLAWAALFSLASVAHVAGYFQSRMEKEETPSA